MPPLPPAFPGAAGRRQLKPGGDLGVRREAAALRPEDDGAGFLLPTPGSRPSSSELPKVPANLPSGGCSAHAQSPTTSSLVGSGLRVRTRGPPRRPSTRNPLLTDISILVVVLLLLHF